MTPKQNQFVLEYLVDLNATRAAIRAGYSPRTADRAAWKLLQRPDVQAAIQTAREAQEKRTGVTADRVILELARVAFANGTDYTQVKVVPGQPGGDILQKYVATTPTEELTPDQRAAVAYIKATDSGIEVKTHDKVKALELLGKHLGLFTEKIAVAAIDPDVVAEVEGIIRDAAASG